MKIKEPEAGRSMVEMLGVLAIIGVLSVGGIAGYSHSMRKHRANGVTDAISKFALISYNQCQQKVLNGEINSISTCTDLKEFQSYFEDAGIGSLPAGVTVIRTDRIESDTTTGTDTIWVSARFDDDKLCKEVGSMVGEQCDQGSFYMKVKQN